MMLLLLGIMDLSVLLLIIAMNFFSYHPAFKIIFFAMLYLVGKAVIFRGSWMNWLDVFIALYLIFLFSGVNSFLTTIIIIYLAYKFLASLL